MSNLRFSSLAFALLLAASPAPAQSCPGDCNRDLTVTVDELVFGAGIALNKHDPVDCSALDRDANGVSIADLVGAVDAALDGCPPVDPVFPANYRSTFSEVRGCRLSIEHGGVSIRVLANPIAEEGYLFEDNPLPVGSIVVKEEFDGPDCSHDNELVRWRVMRKEAPGYSPAGGDWHWQRLDKKRGVVEDGAVEICARCHLACKDRDFTCTDP